MSTEQATTESSRPANAKPPVTATIAGDVYSATPLRDALAVLRDVQRVLAEIASPEVDALIGQAIDQAKEDLRDSDEPRVWTLTEEGYDYAEEEYDNLADALEAAKNNVDRANYDGGGTMWIHVEVRCDDTDESDSAKVTCEPDEPDCGGGEHDWFSPVSLVGGLKENPGVHGHGGGVIITEACKRCGCKKVTDTWAQDRSTGEQGLTSVEYEEGVYDVSYWKCAAIDDTLREAGFSSRVVGKRGEECEVHVSATALIDLSDGCAPEDEAEIVDVAETYAAAIAETERVLAAHAGASVSRKRCDDLHLTITV